VKKPKIIFVIKSIDDYCRLIKKRRNRKGGFLIPVDFQIEVIKAILKKEKQHRSKGK